MFNPFLTLLLHNDLGEGLSEQSIKSNTRIRPHKDICSPTTDAEICHCASSHTFRSVPLRWKLLCRELTLTESKKLVSSLTLKNRNALPDLPHTAFPLERLFPGTNWTLNPSCQSLFPGLFQHSGLRGHRWAAWKSFRDAEHTVAVGHWTLAFFLKCQNPDFYCKTCSLQYSMSVSSRQESL